MNKLNIHRCWGCNDLRKRSSHICAQTQKWLVKLQLWFLIITVKPKNYLVNTECGTNTCPHNTCSNNPIKSAQFGVSYRHLLNGLWWYHKTRDQSKDIARLIASSYEVGCESGKKKKEENCWTCVKKYNLWHACLHYYYRFDCLLSVLYIMLWLQTWKIICMYTLFFSTPMQPHISGYLVVCLIYKFPLMRYIVFISTTIATPLFFLNLLNLFNLLLWSLFFWYSHCGANW